MLHFFSTLATRAAHAVGSIWAFLAAVLTVLVWALSGPAFHYSDTWQLVINTGTTVVTFLMVFLIQNTQNRDARAIHLKLDELIRVLRRARNEMIDIETLDEDQLELLAHKFTKLRGNCRPAKAPEEAEPEASPLQVKSPADRGKSQHHQRSTTKHPPASEIH